MPVIGIISEDEKALLMKKSNRVKNALSAKCLAKLIDPQIKLLPLKDFWDSQKGKWKSNVFGTFGKQNSTRFKRIFGADKFNSA